MHTPIRSKLAIALTAAVGLVASGTAVYAAGLDEDGVHLRAQWTNGGAAWLELEDRNAEPAICFNWENPAPRDGDSIGSSILTRSGTVAVDLGIADQWVEGSSGGCEIPRDNRYRDVFANPENYIVEFRVLERQGLPTTQAVRSHPLQKADD